RNGSWSRKAPYSDLVNWNAWSNLFPLGPRSAPMDEAQTRRREISMRNLSCISMICTMLLLPVEILGQTSPVPNSGPNSCAGGIGGILWKQGRSNNEWEYVPNLSCLKEIFTDTGEKQHGHDESEILDQAEAVF